MLFMDTVPVYSASLTKRINSLLGQNPMASNVKARGDQ